MLFPLFQTIRQETCFIECSYSRFPQTQCLIYYVLKTQFSLLSLSFLSAGVVSVKDPVHLSPLKPSATPTEAEQQSAEGGNPALGGDLQPHHVSMETSNPRPQTPKAEDEMEEEEETSGALTISELVYRSKQF